MTKDFLYRFISKYNLAVLSTISKDNFPESALVGFAVTPDLRLIFDTVKTSRKYNNLIRNPAISFVIGWDNEQTVQYEGEAKIPTENELKNLLPYYYKVYPNGIARKENMKNTVYFCVNPIWIRYSDFNIPANFEEITF